MNDSISTLDELLSDPMVLLVMERDRVRPEQVRMLLDMVWYFMLVFVVAGIFSYLNLGREEDPNFTIKTMIIQANWPGASVKETLQQVTDRIEKKLEELDSLDFTRSVTTPARPSSSST